MNDMSQDTQVRPWYREAYVWMLIAIPFTAVVMGVIMIKLAISTDDGLVVDDYYKQGLEINRTLARDSAAVKHGLSARLNFSEVSKRLEVTISSASDYSPPPYMELYFSHTTRAGFDQLLNLERIGEGVYQSELPELAVGHWQILISADDWRLQGTLQTPLAANQSVLLEARAQE